MQTISRRTVPTKNIRCMSIMIVYIVSILACSGCGIFATPLYDEDVEIIKKMGKMNMVACVHVLDYEFTPTSKNSVYYIDAKGDKKRKEYYFFLSRTSKAFFDLMFDRVLFADSIYTADDSCEVIVDVKMVDVADVSSDSRNEADVTLDVAIDFLRPDDPSGSPIWPFRVSSTGNSERGADYIRTNDRKDANYRGATRAATRGVFIILQRELTSSVNALKLYEDEIYAARDRLLMERTSPSNLSVEFNGIESEDIIENGSVDAFEDVRMKFRATNSGGGIAYDVAARVKVGKECDISAPSQVQLGDIAPGQSTDFVILAHGGEQLSDGEASVSVVAREKRGFESNVSQVTVSTKGIRRPALMVIGQSIEDGSSGKSQGNGNGRAENGELIEFSVLIQNEGEGEAIDARLIGSSAAGLQWIEDEAQLGVIPPGDRVKARLLFKVPRDFSKEEARLKLEVTDVRGVGGAETSVALNVGLRAPDLRFSKRIFSAGGEVKRVHNGEEVELELALDNEGGLAAEDVTLSLEGEGVRIAEGRFDLGDVPAGAKAQRRRLGVSVPRTFDKPELVLHLGVQQADFANKEEVLRIPVDVQMPKLRHEAQLVSIRGGNLLQHRELGKIRVRVHNDGQLDAQEVRVELATPSKWLKIQSEPKKEFGRVRAGGASEWVDFVVEAFRRVGVGPQSLGITVTQRDFPALEGAYALTVVEEKAQVVRVASEPAVSPSQSLGLVNREAPTIKMMSPRPDTQVDGGKVFLAATVTDAEALDNVRVYVQKIRVDLEPGAVSMPSPGRWQIRAEIPVPEGDAEIRVTALNSAYKAAQVSIPVHRTPEENVDEAPIRGGERNPKAVAVVIGVARYKAPLIPPVQFARQDAATMRDYLVYSLGYSKDRVLVAYDADATLGGLRALFGAGGELERRLSPDGGSDVFVYFSGHGVPDQKDWEQYLMPFDGTPDTIASTGYRIADLYARLSELNARSLTVVMDACFSGTSERGALVTGASSATLKVKHPILNFGSNAVALTASTDNQIASWYEAKRHGLFTYYFLSGLRGHADLNDDHSITAAEMQQYLQQSVAKKALQLRGREQTPQVVGDKSAVLTSW